jgi:hypothetical protein
MPVVEDLLAWWDPCSTRIDASVGTHWASVAWVVVVHVEPPLFPILIGVDQLVRQVLGSGIFAHLNIGATEYVGKL